MRIVIIPFKVVIYKIMNYIIYMYMQYIAVKFIFGMTYIIITNIYIILYSLYYKYKKIEISNTLL